MQRIAVLSSGILCLILTMGIARFAYTPLIPVMQNQTPLTDFLAGLLATINYIGYLGGVLITMKVSDWVVKDRLYRAGLIVAVITTAGMAFSDNIWIWSIMRFFAGFCSASGLLIGSGLIVNWLIRHGHMNDLGFHHMGVGIGIALTAVMVDLMIDHLDWQMQWIMFAAVGFVLAIPAWIFLPRPDGNHMTKSGQTLHDHHTSPRFTRLMLLSYCCAGFGYVISATFIVTIVERQPSLVGHGELVWLIVGIAAAPAILFWETVARRIGLLHAMMLAFLLQAIGLSLPLISQTLTAAVLSAVLYGGTFSGIVSLVLSMSGRLVPNKPAQLMAKFTLAYSFAQIAGPFIAGWLAEKTGHYDGGQMLAVVMMVVGSLLLLFLSRTEKADVAVLDSWKR